MQIKTQVGRLVVSTVVEENGVRETMVFPTDDNDQIRYDELFVETHYKRTAQEAASYHFDVTLLLTLGMKEA